MTEGLAILGILSLVVALGSLLDDWLLSRKRT